MIVVNYIVRETFKNQLMILMIISLIFFCQELIRALNVAINGDITINFILPLLSLEMPEILKFSIPLSLGLGLLMTIRNMYIFNEITIMYSCGLSNNTLISAALLLSLNTAVLATLNVMWLTPWAIRYKNQIIFEIKFNPNITHLIEKQFKFTNNGNIVVFIENISNKKFKHVFLAQMKFINKIYPCIVIAKYGYLIKRPDDSQLIILNQGTRYEGTVLSHDFRIINFDKYQIIIKNHNININNSNIEQMNIFDLLKLNQYKAQVELNWRFTLILSTFIMALMVVSLKTITPQLNDILNILIALLFYLLYFVIQTSLHANGIKGKLNSILWMWVTNMIYLFIIILLNFWKSILVKYKIINNYYI